MPVLFFVLQQLGLGLPCWYWGRGLDAGVKPGMFDYLVCPYMYGISVFEYHLGGCRYSSNKFFLL
jgi:hypothetical protein